MSTSESGEWAVFEERGGGGGVRGPFPGRISISIRVNKGMKWTQERWHQTIHGTFLRGLVFEGGAKS